MRDTSVIGYLSISLLLILAVYSVKAEQGHIFIAQLTSEGGRSGIGPNPFDDWEFGENEVTSMGLRQHYLVGYDLSEIYAESLALDRIYSPWQVNIRSTNHNATLMCAQSQLEAIYPPKLRGGLTDNQTALAVPPGDNTSIKKEIDSLGNNIMPDNFQTLPIHAMDFDKDTVLMSDWCSKISEINQRSVNDTEWEATLVETYKADFDVLKTLVGKDTLSVHQIFEYMDSIHARSFNRESIGVLSGHYENLMEFRFKYIEKLWSSEDALRLYSNGFTIDLERYFIHFVNLSLLLLKSILTGLEN
jgi:hypothetical protein